MDEDYIPGEKRSPPMTGFMISGLAGVLFWIVVLAWLAS